MSLFDRAGRKFEETKQAVLSGRDASFVCRACEQAVSEDEEHCPHCGEPAVESVE